jgi:tetratricopeptide (TPR) repeat protein
MLLRIVRLPLLPRFVAVLITLSTLLCAAEVSSVRITEKDIVIPTYVAGPPDPNPMFYFGRQSQGAAGRIYPYPVYDNLTGKKENKTYRMVYIENEYVRIGILPEIGGRIFEGVDKTNNYNFIYRQHVIKPALIGLIGAWISGGVEWNVPHHHRASTFIPVQYKLEEKPDGSKTIWVGELEVRDRMRWAVGYTLRPGKAYLEASLRMVNRTPSVNTMLCFANVAVHVDENYQVIFPPSTQHATYHSKREFSKWPIADTRFAGADYTKGVDVSWYKNHIDSNSFFAWNYEDDFFAGYDHGKAAGIMSVADHNVVPGKKLWTWGNGPNGRIWDRALTDEDGPYIELMTGAYSDNQPDYSWLQPFETKTFSMNWYPFRDIGGVKKANLDAAVNLDIKDGQAKVGFYTTSAYPSATVRIKAGEKILLEEKIAISPAKAYLKQIAVPAGVDQHDVVATLSSGGKELVSYSPVRLKPEAMPKNVADYLPPRDIKTTEELYLTGLRIQQFHTPGGQDPDPYWEEALRRDPGDVRVNTAFGITLYRKARYAEAEKYLRRAIERLTDKYTTPKDGEAFYYLGAALKAQGKSDEAFTQLFKSTWSLAWRSPGYYLLAEIASSRGEFDNALELIGHAIDANALNIRAQNLKAALLRHKNRNGEALQALTAAHRADPLDVRSMAERWLISKTPQALKPLLSHMREHPATAQETAAEYFSEGLWQDGSEVLSQMVAAAPDKSKVNAMVYYYLAYFADKLNQKPKAAEYYGLAAKASPEFVFPFQSDAVDVLRHAMKVNPRDARAPYYLGNLLYDWQPEEAAKLWEASAALDPSFAIVHRNLATAYMHQKPAADTAKAIAALEKAVSLDHKYAMHFTELDELYEQSGAPLGKRLELLERNTAVLAGRDDAVNRLIVLQIATGRYDDAIKVITERPFAIAEGAGLNIADHWTDAYLLRGRKELQGKRYQQALDDFQKALAVPPSLPTGRAGALDRSAEVAYWIGVAYEGAGERQKAVQSWTQGAAPPQASRRGFRNMGLNPQTYYRAMCLAKLGQSEQAKTALDGLVTAARRALEQPSAAGPARASRRGPRSSRDQQAIAHYLLGAGYLGLGDQTKAKQELTQALQLRPDHLDAQATLAELN